MSEPPKPETTATEAEGQRKDSPNSLHYSPPPSDTPEENAPQAENAGMKKDAVMDAADADGESNLPLVQVMIELNDSILWNEELRTSVKTHVADDWCPFLDDHWAIHVPTDATIGEYSKDSFVSSVVLMLAKPYESPSDLHASWAPVASQPVSVGDSVCVWDSRNDTFLIDLIKIKNANRPKKSVMMHLIPQDSNFGKMECLKQRLPPWPGRKNCQPGFSKKMSAQIQKITFLWSLAGIPRDEETLKSAPVVVEAIISSRREKEKLRHDTKSTPRAVAPRAVPPEQEAAEEESEQDAEWKSPSPKKKAAQAKDKEFNKSGIYFFFIFIILNFSHTFFKSSKQKTDCC